MDRRARTTGVDFPYYQVKGWRYSLAWPFDAIKEPVHAETGDGRPAWTRMERGTRHKFEEGE